MFISELDQVLAAFLQQPAVGGMRDRFGITVVSTMILSRLLFLIKPAARAASMVTASKTSTPSSPMRLRQRLRLEGSMGNSVCRYVSPQKYCQYGFSSQVATTASSEASLACCRYSSPATRRGLSAGRPRLEAKWAPKLRSISSQFIKLARRTRGWLILSCSSRRGRGNSPVCGARGLGSIKTSSKFAKNQIGGIYFPANPALTNP